MQTVKLMKTAYIVGKMHTEVKTKGEYVVIFTLYEKIKKLPTRCKIKPKKGKKWPVTITMLCS